MDERKGNFFEHDDDLRHTAHVLKGTGKNDSNTLRVDAYFMENGETNFRFLESPRISVDEAFTCSVDASLPYFNY